MGQKFKIFSDQKPLENFNIKNCKDPKLITILNYISNFDFDIIYNPGENNAEADSLSRNPVLENDNTGDSIIQIVNMVTIEEIIEDQKELKKETDKYEVRNNIYYGKLNNKQKI